MRPVVTDDIDQMTRAYQPLVRKLAWRYVNLLDFDDAVSVGNIGLLEAIRSWQDGRVGTEVPFGTVAYRRIQCRIIDEVRAVYGKRRQRFQRTVSLDAMPEEDKDRWIAAPEEPEDVDWGDLGCYISQLTFDEQRLLKALYGQDERISALSEEWDVPVYHLLRFRDGAIAKLRVLAGA